MSTRNAIRHIRKELALGDHLYQCFADTSIRRLGWRRIQAARRIARRLKLQNLFS